MAFELTPKSLRKICRDNKLCVPHFPRVHLHDVPHFSSGLSSCRSYAAEALLVGARMSPRLPHASSVRCSTARHASSQYRCTPIWS